jgi:hypothetical protein
LHQDAEQTNDAHAFTQRYSPSLRFVDEKQISRLFLGQHDGFGLTEVEFRLQALNFGAVAREFHAQKFWQSGMRQQKFLVDGLRNEHFPVEHR